jgi:hypothetical protein
LDTLVENTQSAATKPNAAAFDLYMYVKNMYNQQNHQLLSPNSINSSLIQQLASASPSSSSSSSSTSSTTSSYSASSTLPASANNLLNKNYSNYDSFSKNSNIISSNKTNSNINLQFAK